ncbi:MAG TPA: ATP-binding cassette domain-containing protein [Acidimicrobiales bacterium]|jgi:ABC-type lipoprotein export system ATPase subunit|nr:ATP-binding cassette domain-containing protein [Acidimicrobiales bacterium]
MPERAAGARCQGVTRVYRSASGPVLALHEVDAAVAPGQVTAVVGPSGSGKSTLLRIMAALDRPTEGDVQVAGHDLNALSRRARRTLRRRHIGFMLPRPADNLLPYLTAAEHVQLAADLRGAPMDDGLLPSLGLDHRLHHRPLELSGGEQQRLALAAAVVGDPGLVLADEPTAELDQASAARLIDALRTIAGRGSALAVATHDPLVVEAADHVIRIIDGEVVL